ncbi:unnamed protein product [Callosobruchus maculatus]|uniref:Uncharacterized protein n=1 Tax=Callosobruchus maculatus TaxID=64391 RepID=A0A653BST0_CALMS|nr:unnamed protein product [Callosobruchus maculatus]
MKELLICFVITPLFPYHQTEIETSTLGQVFQDILSDLKHPVNVKIIAISVSQAYPRQSATLAPRLHLLYLLRKQVALGS